MLEDVVDALRNVQGICTHKKTPAPPVQAASLAPSSSPSSSRLITCSTNWLNLWLIALAFRCVTGPLGTSGMILGWLPMMSSSDSVCWRSSELHSSTSSNTNSALPLGYASSQDMICLNSIRIYETSIADDKKQLNGLSAVSLIIAVYLMIIIILKNTFRFSSWANVVTLVCLLVLLLLALLIARRAQQDHMEKIVPPDNSPLVSTPKATTSSNQSSEGDNKIEAGLSENLNLLQAMKTLSFWLLFIAIICGMGSGLSTINNIRQIGESLRYSSIEINSLVALWSIWNFLGRFGAGYASDALLHRKGWPHPLLMAATLGMMVVGHLIIASGFQGNLYVGSVIVGVCYGSQWSLMPTITSEIFGVRHMGTIVNTISVASPIGSYIFSVRLIGSIYDKTASGERTCYDSRCFRLSFVIMAYVAFFGFLVAIVLCFRTRRLYRPMVSKRLQLHRRYRSCEYST